MLPLFYACYFSAYGVSIPFFPVYLRRLGLSEAQVAVMLSVAPALHLGVPLVWGWLADRTRRRNLFLALACGGACLWLLLVARVRRFEALLPLYAAHQLFAVPVLALADSLAIADSRRRGTSYTRVRLWGSVSFLIACLAAGAALTRASLMGLVPISIAAGYGVAGLAALGVPQVAAETAPRLGDLARLLGDRRLLLLLPIAGLHWATLAPYHGFLGILATERGLSPLTTSLAFAVAVAAEVTAFFFFPRLERRFTPAALMAVAAAATSLRWYLTARVTSGAALVAVQALHGLTFGVFWASAMVWLAAAVPAALRATGQAVYGICVFGLGNLLGYTGCGLLSARAGTAGAFRAGAALELVPLALLVVTLVADGRRGVRGAAGVAYRP
jgi:PPP family 3-phenylpropionic acid transporter